MKTIIITAGLAVVFVAGGVWAARSLLLPPRRRSVRQGWKPERRDG